MARRIVLLLLLSALLCLLPVSAQQSSCTARIIRVTQIADLLPALALQECRYIVIEATGYLELNGMLDVRGDGLRITGNANFGIRGGGLTIWASDVHISHLIILSGPDAPNPSSSDSLFIRGHNVLVEHSVIGWAMDENLAIYGTNVTIRNSVIMEGLNRSNHPEALHSMSAFAAYFNDNVTLDSNLLINGGDRNPQITGGRVTLVNNIIQNPQRLSTLLQARDKHIEACLRFNTYIHGPDSGGVNDAPNRVSVRVQTLTTQAPFNVYLWLQDNRNRVRTTADRPETDITYRDEWRPAYQEGPIPSWCANYSQKSRADILNNVGAGDRFSARMVAQVPESGYVSSIGKVIDSPAEVGGYPDLAAGEPPTPVPTTTVTQTPLPTATHMPSVTPIVTVTPVPSATPTLTPTATATPSETATIMPTPAPQLWLLRVNIQGYLDIGFMLIPVSSSTPTAEPEF